MRCVAFACAFKHNLLTATGEQLRVGLGNTGKPDVIVKMEQAIWRAVIQISVGVRPEDTLEDINVCWELLRGGLSEADSDWFQHLARTSS